MRTTLRFASVVGGVGGLVLLAAIILSASDWFSASPGDDHRIAVHRSAPAPAGAPSGQGPVSISQPGAGGVPPAAVPAPPPHGPMALATTGNAAGGVGVVSSAGDRHAGDHKDDHRAHGGGGGHGDR